MYIMLLEVVCHRFYPASYSRAFFSSDLIENLTCGLSDLYRAKVNVRNRSELMSCSYQLWESYLTI